jgi:nicotinate phosphoribosyltransferase
LNGLLTDLYELTMAAGYFAAAKQSSIAIFDIFLRRLPRNRCYVMVSGVEDALNYLENLSFSAEEIDYIRGLPVFRNAPPEFFDHLRQLRFTGDVDCVPEGTLLFEGEPLMTVRAPIIEAQIPETYLLSALTFETLIATKASRMVEAAHGRSVVEFGTRRAHTPQAGVLGARAAYIGGCLGTSNTLTGFRYGVPVYGTAAHSWVMSFDSEREAFKKLQQLLGEYTVQLVDTYDPLQGVKTAAELGKPLWGIRIDSGDLLELSRQARRILDDARLRDARIMVSGDLDENRISELVKAGAPIDAFGVGTELVTSGDAPSMGVVYKMTELIENGRTIYTAKRSADKPSLPGTKQIWRYPEYDLVSLVSETFDGAEPLLIPQMRSGKLVRKPEPLKVIRALAERQRALGSQPRPVRHSEKLEELIRETNQTV